MGLAFQAKADCWGWPLAIDLLGPRVPATLGPSGLLGFGAEEINETSLGFTFAAPYLAPRPIKIEAHRPSYKALRAP